MASVRINLLDEYKRPTFRMETTAGFIDVLLDTGAFIPVWNGEAEQLCMNFLEAVSTGFCIPISGFGGSSRELYEIWKIPSIVLEDRNNGNRLNINNVLLAIIDDKRLGFDFILSSTLLAKLNYALMNDTGLEPRFLEIEYKRDIYCVPNTAHDNHGRNIVIDGKTVVDGINVFYQESVMGLG